MDIAACGIIQLLRTCAMKRASHGPNSTPLRVELDRLADVLILRRRAGCRSSPAARTSHVADRVGDDADRGPARLGLVASVGRTLGRRRRIGQRSGGVPLLAVVAVCGCGVDGFGRRVRRRLASMRSGELPRANGIGFVGLRRALHGLRPPIEVGQLRARRRLRRRSCRAAAARRRTAPSARAAARAAARTCSSIAFCCCSHRSRCTNGMLRPEQDRDQHERVEVDRQSARLRAATAAAGSSACPDDRRRS